MHLFFKWGGGYQIKLLSQSQLATRASTSGLQAAFGHGAIPAQVIIRFWKNVWMRWLLDIHDNFQKFLARSNLKIAIIFAL